MGGIERWHSAESQLCYVTMHKLLYLLGLCFLFSHLYHVIGRVVKLEIIYVMCLAVGIPSIQNSGCYFYSDDDNDDEDGEKVQGLEREWVSLHVPS